jgi:G6PDH family F420-dependent oxidoreductase
LLGHAVEDLVMTAFGYALSSEEHPPEELVRLARRAEEVGFDFAMISDHYHPWTSQQGQSGFVWSVLGAIAQQTRHLRVGTGVTCPILRIHPAIIAQAAATTARLFGGRFSLGVGSGENLNEHILGLPWPEPTRRLEMLEEAIGVMRRLWEGESVTHRGTFYTVEQARLFTLPTEPPPILVAASGPESAGLAGRAGDGLVGTAPDAKLVAEFEKAGGGRLPRYGQIGVCYARSEKSARKTVLEIWPNTGLSGDLAWEIKTVALFEEAVKRVREEDVEDVVCGPDLDAYLEAIERYAAAGYDHVYLHQIGHEQDAFLEFCERELLPAALASANGTRRKKRRER